MTDAPIESVELTQDELIAIAVALREMKERYVKRPKSVSVLLYGKGDAINSARDKIATAHNAVTDRYYS